MPEKKVKVRFFGPVKVGFFGPVPGGPDSKPRKTNRPFVKKPLRKAAGRKR